MIIHIIFGVKKISQMDWDSVSNKKICTLISVSEHKQNVMITFGNLNFCFYKSLQPTGSAKSKIYALLVNSNSHKFIHFGAVLFQFRINSTWLIAFTFLPRAMRAFAEVGSL